jgi:hypothetical protein
MTQDPALNKRRMVVAIAVLALGALAPMITTQALADHSHPSATTAHTVNAKDEGHLHLAGNNGSLLLEEGPVSGSIPGTVKVRFNVGATVTGSFTIYAKDGGSISGHGSGRLHSTSTNSSFGGTITVTGGTGRYKHAHGNGGLYGTINRKTDAMIVQTTGTLHY